MILHNHIQMHIVELHEDKQPNERVIFGCFHNVVLDNVRYAIKDFEKPDLDEEIEKSYDMVENIPKSNVDPNLILGEVQRQMISLSMNPQHTLISRNVESSRDGR